MFQHEPAAAASKASLWDVIPHRDPATARPGAPPKATPWLFGPGEVEKKKANQAAADQGVFGDMF